MENRLKERLTGAAILVALIVLVVPEMFRGPRTPSAGSGATSGEGPPLRSYTIDLGAAGADAAPMRITPAARSSAARPTPPEAAAAVVPVPVPVGAPVTAAAPAPAAASALASTAPAAAAPRALSAPAHSAPAVPVLAEAPAATSSTGWNVQLGLFAKSENAQRMLHNAEAKGFAPRVSRSGSKGLYRVSVDGLADRGAAEQMSRRLRAAGFAAAVAGPR